MNRAPLPVVARNRFRTAATGLALAAVLAGLSACGGDETTGTASDAGASAAQDAAGAADGGTGSGSGSGDSAGTSTVKLGETVVEPRKFELTVTSVTTAERVDGRSGEKETPDGAWVLVTLKAKNIADYERSLLISDQKYLADDGTEFLPKRAVYPDNGPDVKEGYRDLDPGETGSAVLAFDVPVGTELAKLELHGTALTDGVVVTAPYTVE